ncbi:MAG: RNase H family protein, partial [Pirellulaceae bacterium]|nr:RNase H family protein [Pirellulaceae bacterium]
MFDDNRLILLVQTHNRCWHPTGGSWRFLIQSAAGQVLLDAGDIEPDVSGERLDLLTVVRGLEALEQESCVTLITDQRYVLRGMRYGLEEWREQDWKWQRFGDLVEINHADLWKRLDHALSFHQVQCRQFRI